MAVTDQSSSSFLYRFKKETNMVDEIPVVGIGLNGGNTFDMDI